MQLQLGHFQRLAHAALFMLTGLVLLLFVVLFGSRLQVNESLRAEIQRQTLENAGLAIEIGTLRGNWWSGLTLQDVKVHAGPEPTSPLLGTVPLVQVEYTLFSFLGPRPVPMRVDAYRVNAGVAVAANRLFNLQPRPKAPHDEKPADPPPPVDMVFHGGHVSYADNSVRKPFLVEVGNLTGVGTLRGFKLQLDLQALREHERINAHVDYDLAAQRGDVKAHGRGLSLPYWVNRFGYAPEYELTAGRADLDAEAHWKDPMLMEEFKLSGTARVWDGEAKIKNVAVPLVGLHGDLSFTQDVADLPKLEGTIEGMPVVVRGRVSQLLLPVPALGGPDQHLDLAIETPKVELEKLSRLWPGIKGLGLRGLGAITAKVGGTTMSPHVVMRGLVPSGHYGKEPCKNVVIDADYTTGRFDLPHYELDVADGHAVGKAFVGIPEQENAPIPYTVDATFKGAQIAHWTKRYLEEPLPFAVDGRLRGDLKVRGLGGDVKTDLDLSLADGHLAHEPIQAATASYHYATPTWDVPAWKLDWGKTHVTGRAHGGDNSPFRLDFKVTAGELAQWVKLNREPPKTRIAGPAHGEGGFGGPAGDPNRWTGGARLFLPSGIIDRQTFTDGHAELALANNVLTIARGEAHTVGGLVRANGTYGPFVLKHAEYPTTSVDISAVGMKLGLVANLPESMKTARGELSGRFNWFLHDQDLHVTGRATVDRPRLPGWAHLDHAVADFRWTPTLLTLHPLTVAQGADRYEVTGTVGQVDETYPMDLRIRAPRADVKTVLGAVQWPDVMARLQPQRVREQVALGPVRAAAGLPAAPAPASRGGQPMTLRRGSGASFELAKELDRWLSYKKAPLNRAPAEAPLLPFWQESSGKFWLDAHVTGPVKQPAVHLAAAVKQLRVFDRTLDEGSLVLGLDRDRLAIPRLRLVEGGKTVLTAGGAIGDNAADALVIRTFGLDLGWTRRALASKGLQLDGKGDLVLRLAGPLASPRAQAQVGLRNGHFLGPGLEPIGFERLDANLAYERGRLAIQKAAVRQGGKEAGISGSIPLGTDDPTAKLDLAVRLEDGNLAILNLFGGSRFQWLGGKGLVELRLGGVLNQPTLAGKIALREGSFRAQGLNEPVTDFGADVTLTDQRIDMRRVEGHFGGGDLVVAGTVLWDQFLPQKLDLTAKAKPFRLKLPNDYYQGTVAADLTLKGPVAQPALGGMIALSDGKVEVRDDAKAKPETPAAVPPLRLDGLNVVLGPGLRIKNSLIDIDVTTLRQQGHLVVDGSVAAPQPRGVVIIDGGTIRPLNNPFKISEGKVEFLGEKLKSNDDLLDILTPAAKGASPMAALNARLDVQARTTVYDYTQDEHVNVLAHVTGSLDQMDMRFTSEPLRSEQEILDILSKKQVLAGTFGGKLDRGEVIVKEVGGFVTSNLEELISPYTLALRNALNLQTLRFELVNNYKKASLSDIAGYRPALTLETRPLWERLSLNSRLVAGEFYSTDTGLYTESTYVGVNFRLNRYLGLEYRINPYVDPTNDRVLGQTLGIRSQITF